MDLSLDSPWRSLWRVFSLVRYRFFLYAGLLPYLLGAAWACAVAGRFDAAVFWSGLGGVVLAVVGVESFNEYFDSRMGTDRVFNPEDLPPMSGWVLWLGVAAFAGAAAIGIYLTYRGLGEAVIALSYGPWMVLGSLYLHTGTLSWGALWASLVPGLLIMALAVVNAIPDYHQDRLVGKRNLVVRLGRKRGVWLYLSLAAAGLLVAVVGVVAGVFPLACLAALLAAPLLVKSARVGVRTYESPRQFVPAIRAVVACYLVAVSFFSLGLLWPIG